MDVDGVLTDGGIWYTDHGDELKRFDVRDGQGSYSCATPASSRPS
jgi:3-deoxy-D-manno-octulosonate 8-phosphate phosphatase (KDO 8-P phosphatase)